MKNLKLTVFAIIAVFIAAIVLSADTGAQSKLSDETSSFQSSGDWKKLGPSIQKVWLDAMKSGSKDKKIDCFVRVEDPADQGDKAFLISNGYNVRVFSGDVATGYLKAKDLRRVARQPFVMSIRLSTKSK